MIFELQIKGIENYLFSKQNKNLFLKRKESKITDFKLIV